MTYLFLIPVFIAALAWWILRDTPGCCGSCQQGRKDCDCVNRE